MAVMTIYILIALFVTIAYKMLRGEMTFGMITLGTLALMGSFTGGYLFNILQLNPMHYNWAYGLAFLVALIFVVATDLLRAAFNHPEPHPIKRKPI